MDVSQEGRLACKTNPVPLIYRAFVPEQMEVGGGRPELELAEPCSPEKGNLKQN